MMIVSLTVQMPAHKRWMGGDYSCLSWQTWFQYGNSDASCLGCVCSWSDRIDSSAQIFVSASDDRAMSHCFTHATHVQYM